MLKRAWCLLSVGLMLVPLAAPAQMRGETASPPAAASGPAAPGDRVVALPPGGGDTEKFASRDDAVRAVRELTPAYVTAALDAATRYGRALPAATGKLATIGFCWGGAQSFSYATARGSTPRSAPPRRG